MATASSAARPTLALSRPQKHLCAALGLMFVCYLLLNQLGSLAALGMIGGLLWVCAALGAMYRLRAEAKEDAAEAAARRPNTAPPIWPPRRPDDWGRDVEVRHRRAVKEWEYRASLSRAAGGVGGGGSPPPQPLIPSWEAHHAREQERDPLQIRWAQNETGEWVKVVWGNRSMPPNDGGALPVAQSMARQSDGVWCWVWIGQNVVLDWQRGPQRMEEFRDPAGVVYRRPLGSPAHQDAPEPVEPAGEHGSSDWGDADDLAALGAVSPHR